jgi:hypothetical protein
MHTSSQEGGRLGGGGSEHTVETAMAAATTSRGAAEHVRDQGVGEREKGVLKVGGERRGLA